MKTLEKLKLHYDIISIKERDFLFSKLNLEDKQKFCDWLKIRTIT